MWPKRPCVRSIRRSALLQSKNVLPVGIHGQFLIGKGTAPGSAAPSSDLPGSRRSSAAEGSPQEDLLYRNSLEATAVEIPECWIHSGNAPFRFFHRRRETVGELRTLLPFSYEHGTEAVCFVGLYPASDCDGKCRRTEECNGCTYCHLPVSSCNPPAFRKEDAKRAIFAARIARSNFPMRLWLK